MIKNPVKMDLHFCNFAGDLTRDVRLHDHSDFFKLFRFVEDLNRSMGQSFVCASFRLFRVKTPPDCE